MLYLNVHPRGNHPELDLYLKANSCCAVWDSPGTEPGLFVPGFLPFLTSLLAAVYLQNLFLFHLDYRRPIEKGKGGFALRFTIAKMHKDLLDFLKKEFLLDRYSELYLHSRIQCDKEATLEPSEL